MKTNMTSNEKAELMQDAIERLYSKEGRSKSYIADLLGISRKTITDKIGEWELIPAEPRRHASPSTRKWLDANRDRIRHMLDNNMPTSEIARVIGCSREKLVKTAYVVDPTLKRAHDDMMRRQRAAHADLVDDACAVSHRNYDYERIDGEVWKPILGYTGYEVSDKGRVRRYAQSYERHYLLAQAQNKNNGRLYVTLAKDDGTRKNLQVARIVAHTFLAITDELDHPTVDHIDGNVTNNKVENLAWVSQSENNRKAYAHGRAKVRSRKFVFKRLVYKGRYEFKTIEALARFMGKSPTQVRRYLEQDPAGHGIEIVR